MEGESGDKFYTVKEVPLDKKQEEPIPDEWFEYNHMSNRSFQINFTHRQFSAEQWLKFFQRYTSQEFLAKTRRMVVTTLHHALRVVIILQTMDYCERGYYLIPPSKEGEPMKKVVFNVPWIHSQIRRTTAYKRAPALPPFEDKHETVVSVYEGDCIEAARCLQLKGFNPLVLNMANQTQPGGGYRSGSGAQEENLHRRSNYYQSLEDPKRIQEDGGKRNYPISDDGAIYSPNIVVFRASEAKGYAYLEEPYLMDFIACAALAHPPLLYSKERGFYMTPDGEEAMKAKIRTMLAVGIVNGHDSMVLSAFGCGAFCCPPSHVAVLFQEIIESEEFKGRFKQILFAIFDDHNARRQHNPEGNVKPFVDVFKNRSEM